MRISIHSSKWKGRWIAGIAVLLAITALYYSTWLIKPDSDSSTEQMGLAAHKKNGNGEGNSYHFPSKNSLSSAGKKIERVEDHLRPIIIDPEQVYYALTSLNPAELVSSLEILSRFPEKFYAFNTIYKRIIELSSNGDQQIAILAQGARSQLMAMRALHEIPEPTGSEAAEADQNEAGTSAAYDPLETAVQPFDTLQEQALDDPDPSVRLGGIETAMSQRDENVFSLLSEAARSDQEADNRLSAVSELEQMLKSGMGDRNQIRLLLEETSMDSDPRVAELSQLIIEEQLNASMPQN
jgi:hypothetical protein